MKNLKQILIPTLCLTIISVVATSLMAGVNFLTEDRIKMIHAQLNEVAKREVLPEADEFIEKQIYFKGEDVFYYKSKNGSGFVFKTSGNGYGGEVAVTVGVTDKGEISGIRITSQNETPGLGQRIMENSFTNQFLLEVPLNGFEITTERHSQMHEISAITGATISTAAVLEAVNEAIAIYNEIMLEGEYD